MCLLLLLLLLCLRLRLLLLLPGARLFCLQTANLLLLLLLLSDCLRACGGQPDYMGLDHLLLQQKDTT